MPNVYYFLILVLILLIIISWKFLDRYNFKDYHIVQLSILEHLLNDYINLVLQNKIRILQRQHDLNPESKVNSIKTYEKKISKLVSISTLEIIQILPPKTRRYLLKNIGGKALSIMISNHIKQNL